MTKSEKFHIYRMWKMRKSTTTTKIKKQFSLRENSPQAVGKVTKSYADSWKKTHKKEKLREKICK